MPHALNVADEDCDVWERRPAHSPLIRTAGSDTSPPRMFVNWLARHLHNSFVLADCTADESAMDALLETKASTATTAKKPTTRFTGAGFFFRRIHSVGVNQ